MIIAPTLVRWGFNKEGIESRLARFNPDFRILPVGVQTTRKYGLWVDDPQQNYLLVVSRSQLPVSTDGHNSVLTLTSEDERLNQRVYGEFLNATGLDFNIDPAPYYERIIKKEYAWLFPQMKGGAGKLIKIFPRISGITA